MAVFRQAKFLGFWAGIVIALVYFHLHGFVFNFSDETFILFPAERVAAGNVLYRDIVVTYTPAAIWLVALADKLLGASVLIGRILMVLVSLITSVGIYGLVRWVSTRRLSPYLAVMFYLVWGPFQINWPAPGMFSLASGVWACLFLINRGYFWAGMLTFMSFLFKQNFGLAMILTSLFYFRGRLTREYVFGLLVPAVVFFGYMVLNHSWWPFVNIFDVYVFKKFFMEGYASTPIGNVLYFGPIIIIVWFLVTFRKQKSWWLLAVFVGMYYLFGIRPVADYVHLVPLIAISGILLAVVNFPITILMIIFGFYLSLFGNYYRWGPSLVSQNYYDSNQMTRIYTTDSLSRKRDEIIKAVITWSDDSDAIMVDDYAPWLYFYSGKTNATRFIFITPNSLTPEWEAEMERRLTQKRTPLVITKNEDKDFYLIPYISDYYHKVDVVEGYSFWRRNET